MADSPRKHPSSPEAEEAVLGAMMLSPRALLVGMEELTPQDFHITRNRAVFEAISRVFDKKSNLDTVSVAEELTRAGLLEDAGGYAGLAALVENVLSPALITRHTEILREMSVYRNIIKTATGILEESYKAQKPANELLDEVENRVLAIRESRLRSGFLPVRDMVDGVTQEIDAAGKSDSRVTGLPTGFKDVDRLLAGLQNGDLIIIAARPSMGKTSLALNIHRYLGVELNIPTAAFSLEMSAQALVHRLLAMEARLPGERLRVGKINRKEQNEKLVPAVNRLKEAPIYIDDSATLTVLEMKARARRIVREKGVKLISIDYLTLITGPRAENRQQEVAAMTRSLKALAKELSIPVIVVSQLSRETERRESKRPILADLRESGAIEQDADVVMFLYRKDYYRRTSGPPEADGIDQAIDGSRAAVGLTDLIIAKQRSGPTDTVRLAFLQDQMRFENAAAETAGADVVDYSDLPI